MSWNYRVIRYPETEDSAFAIHEVYYDKEGRPTSWAENPIAPLGDNLLELRAEVEYMLEAFDKPVLTIVDDKLIETTCPHCGAPTKVGHDGQHTGPAQLPE
jgi:hypothetical protein